MHRVLATLVATALLIGCGEHEQQSFSSRAAYLASAEAHAAAFAVVDAASWNSSRAPDAVGRACDAANQAADAVGTDEFYPAVRKADAAAADAWEKTQEFSNWLGGPTSMLAPDLAAKIEASRTAVLEASRKAWEAAERAMASHD